MDGYILHPHTADAVHAFAQAPAHAVLLLGANGIGKGTLAQVIAARVLQLSDAEKLATYPHVKQLAATGKESISIEQIRELQQFVRLRTTGSATIRRVIIVEHAEAMTTEAQNAFLKLLEEPPADTIIIMTASHIHNLLPTIRSRVQTITITPPVKDKVTAFFAKQYTATQVTQAYFLSGGLPGLMHALLEGDTSHPLVQHVGQAKQTLQQSPFERLVAIDGLTKDKANAQLFCEALARIAEAGIAQASAKTDDKRLRQWHRILRETHEAQEAFAANANTKLVLTNLMLQL